MRLTTKGRYAVTAMLDLALHADERPVSLLQISQRQCISVSYLEQLFSLLRKKGLVSSMRGPGGGYRLAYAREEITIAHIIDAVNESVNVTACQGEGDCQDGEMCLTHHLWCTLSGKIYAFLSGIHLGHLVDDEMVGSIAKRQAQQKNIDDLVVIRQVGQ